MTSRRDKASSAIALCETGTSLEMALLEIGISRSALHCALSRYGGELKHRYIQLFGLTCDYCQGKYMMKSGIAYGEVYDGAPIRMQFCSKDCKDRWDKEDNESETGMLVWMALKD